MVFIRMESQCQSPVSILNLLLLSLWRDPEYFVEALAIRVAHRVQLDRVVVSAGDWVIVMVKFDCDWCYVCRLRGCGGEDWRIAARWWRGGSDGDWRLEVVARVLTLVVPTVQSLGIESQPWFTTRYRSQVAWLFCGAIYIQTFIEFQSRLAISRSSQYSLKRFVMCSWSIARSILTEKSETLYWLACSHVQKIHERDHLAFSRCMTPMSRCRQSIILLGGLHFHHGQQSWKALCAPSSPLPRCWSSIVLFLMP